ncbi:MAG: nitroreductase family protein [Sphaerochaetaceae bacterium]|jgi:nitroreductase|nr:nitroreductase family protein [Sphaerochaetaceae bacterium]MDD3163117.1 nitroreductase family protein [Sphaerochaetaceae bacterium]MDD4006661.1 nitroreductase family protein [Sphaerochaetaceae bacterium]MDD4396215.1 nitroreductase family protein [Sphaerochaetaceae bacterium]
MQEIFSRRSIRNFEDRKVEREKVNRLLEAAMQAPSAQNQREWTFVVVDDKQELMVLSRVSPYSGMVAKSPVTIVVLCDTARLAVPEIWQQDMAACTENILLEAVHLGLGACWMGIAPSQERMDAVAKIVGAPPSVKVFGMVSVGYPAEGKENRFIDRFDRNAIHLNRW